MYSKCLCNKIKCFYDFSLTATARLKCLVVIRKDGTYSILYNEWYYVSTRMFMLAKRIFTHLWHFLIQYVTDKYFIFYSHFRIHLSYNIMVLREHLRVFHGTDGGHYWSVWFLKWICIVLEIIFNICYACEIMQFLEP